MKLLIGGSPCTHWSIAQTKNRETEASGVGWELFLNYRIARDKYQPDYFLYENNKSMSPAIRAQITEELGVEPVLINSALVSAQNRQRLYWVGKRNPGGTYSQVDVKQPADCGILLRDILESRTSEKAYPLKTLTEREMAYMVGDHEGYSDRWTYLQKPGEADKSCCITANVHRGIPYNVLAVPVAGRVVGRRINEQGHRDDYNEAIPHFQYFEVNEDEQKTNCLTTVQKDNVVAVPVRVGAMPGKDGEIGTSQSRRVYSADGKSVSLQARPNGGGADGAATGLYAMPASTDGKQTPVYEVRGGRITIKGKQYPIKLTDGFYIIRKLTVTECKRLQTVPDAYEFPVSNTQAYKMLGNGWTVDVIAHIMHHFEGLTEEPVEVLSMYDGMSCGHIALDKLGVTISVYYATEIDKYAIQTTQHNFPDTVQLGDAFQVRGEDWRLPGVPA